MFGFGDIAAYSCGTTTFRLPSLRPTHLLAIQMHSVL